MKTPTYKPFKINLPTELLFINNLFQSSNLELYLVGGAVRDAILNLNPKDYDLATNATPDKVLSIFQPLKDYTVLESGKVFGVIKIIHKPSGAEYEITTFRSDIGKGRHPQFIIFTTIDQDAIRRDLTINGLFYDIQKNQIIDFVGGIGDLENKIIRTIGDPLLRFDEDKLRILRAIRFSTRFQYSIEPNSSHAIKTNNILHDVSHERIREELIKGILTANHPNDYFILLNEYGLWSQIFPNLNIYLKNPAPNSKKIPIQLALLLQQNDPKLLSKTLNQLKYSSDEIAQITFLIQFQNLQIENAFNLKKMFQKSKLSNEDLSLFSQYNELSPKLTKAFISFNPSISGESLLTEGFEGKNIGQEQIKRETKIFKSILDSFL